MMLVVFVRKLFDLGFSIFDLNAQDINMKIYRKIQDFS